MPGMDEESLRKEITQQVQAQFEDQLRELKREKMSVEEEMEAASQRWRAERRRLNSEIERLEDATSARRSPGEGSAEPVDTGALEQAFEERLRQASAEWAAERERLKAEISRLEHSVTEAIARSSNPIRTTQSIKDQFEVKLMDAEQMRLRVEREFLHAKSNWEEEKKRLMADLMKLRRLAPSSSGLQVKDMMDRLHGRTETLEEARIRELETQLTETRATILRYHDTGIKTSQELAGARKEVQNLNRELIEIREQIDAGSVDQLRRQYDANVQDLVEKNLQLAQKLQAVPAAAGAGSSAMASAPSPTAGSTHMDAEIDRIGKAIEAIDTLIDDPDTPASLIATKKVERSALEAYLRGILFSLGRGDAL
jgi:hypothetical protein